MQLKERATDISENPLVEQPTESLTALELFAGAGGLALGVHAAGFRHVGLIEWNGFAAQTLRDNSQRTLEAGDNLVFNCDVRSLDYSRFVNKVDLLTGGPPCQPFSTSGSSLGPDDSRDMFPAFLDVAALLMPKAILIENVKGLLREKFHKYFNYILRRLQYPLCLKRADERWQEHYQRLLALKKTDFSENEQYVVTFQLVNTADYGIPQRRERVIITAFRCDLKLETFNLEPTHSKEALFYEQWITGAYWERYSIPPQNYLGSQDKKLVETLKGRLFSHQSKLPWCTVRDAIHDLPRPVDRGKQEEIPNHIQHPGAREYQGHWASILDYPSKVLKAGTHGTPGGENMVRIPEENVVRYYTTREAARLQTFPDNWYFHGTWGACIKQLGNAVPVELIRIFATEINNRLISSLSRKA